MVDTLQTHSCILPHRHLSSIQSRGWGDVENPRGPTLANTLPDTDAWTAFVSTTCCAVFPNTKGSEGVAQGLLDNAIKMSHYLQLPAHLSRRLVGALYHDKPGIKVFGQEPLIQIFQEQVILVFLVFSLRGCGEGARAHLSFNFGGSVPC